MVNPKLSAITQIAIKDWLLILGLIFGGCCSNVFTLEKIVTTNPDSGNIVTFAQFLFIALEGYIHFFDKTRPPFYIKENKVPLKRWSLTIIMFFLISILNNSVFIFKISIPIHIIFRSSGTAVVMIIGWLIAKKTYNRTQIASALLLTLGAIITTLYKDSEFLSKRDEIESTGGFLETISNDVLFFIGIGVLLFAAILMALLGLYNEETYRKYGKHWQENVFYSHLFGLPIFIFILPKIISEFKALLEYPETFNILGWEFPKQVVYLGLNVLTQFFCVRGANMLAGNTTALTVSVVLLLRKFTSLLLSMWLFNNSLSKTGSFGAFLVFFGAFLYSYGSTQNKSPVVKPPQEQQMEIREEIEFKELKPNDKDDVEKAKLAE
ncbi:UDP-N-acetylglucosamine transporter yea4 [Wickerhamomyces ciferrii]|uniref:UDP-N-acetylglucosamine transporter yea4 n=1 Tax=Wickerhamomyces ciferrii (strain ATCC 14091 / BCRC 22168 / CBS 111 / JCM 3599 / NBRC 0793 / NRRL Y-1031 F-60-10) TaxID=1206466 RepID=K0KDD0_WICCF|nr:UDP-N-acetylglucosamine transporter yea4 [Wickerhamomyces ciferrii]CCH40911.1 UDP-N-acetylglucosamine transporter yea4 [Wickerhamomyces ciferrii]